jgi:hypothetical protein
MGEIKNIIFQENTINPLKKKIQLITQLMLIKVVHLLHLNLCNVA